MATIGTVIAGLLLAGATTFGIVSSQSNASSGDGLPKSGTVVTYEQGQ
ncbi:MAG: hypothetical protein JWM02_826 [Frankiales bacterium]|nr:hypothetical protein [Frankiales bacterium]